MKKKMFSILMLTILLLSLSAINVYAASERILEVGENDYYPATATTTSYSIGDWATIILGILSIILFLSYLITVFLWKGMKNKNKTLDRLYPSTMIFIIITMIVAIINGMWV